LVVQLLLAQVVEAVVEAKVLQITYQAEPQAVHLVILLAALAVQQAEH
jgi:hypothetical protein